MEKVSVEEHQQKVIEELEETKQQLTAKTAELVELEVQSETKLNERDTELAALKTQYEEMEEQHKVGFHFHPKKKSISLFIQRPLFFSSFKT
jgi:DNA repair exonuclease SbcCD ATPase subunit